MFKFAQHGKCGTWVSELLPHTAEDRRRHLLHQVDAHRGDQPRPGHHLHPDRAPDRPAGRSIGAWLSYGLGSENQNLPAFVVLISQGSGNQTDQPLLRPPVGQRLPADAASGRAASARGGDPVLYLSNPPGVDDATPPARCSTTSAQLNQLQLDEIGDPEIAHAHRPVRDGLPHADERAGADRPLARSRSDVSSCTAPSRRKPGTFAANCLLARRLAERGVRFVQLYPPRLGPARQPARRSIREPVPATSTSRPRPSIQDLKQRGLLDDTLVIWGGEFGRTVYCQGDADRRRTTAATTTRAASPCGWPAAASSRASPTARPTTSATTSSKDPVHVHDLHATILHCLGIDHTRLTFKFQGRDYRLTDVHGKVVKEILA